MANMRSVLWAGIRSKEIGAPVVPPSLAIKYAFDPRKVTHIEANVNTASWEITKGFW